MSKQHGMFRRFLVKEGQKLVDILDEKAEEPIVPSTALPDSFFKNMDAYIAQVVAEHRPQGRYTCKPLEHSKK